MTMAEYQENVNMDDTERFGCTVILVVTVFSVVAYMAGVEEGKKQAEQEYVIQKEQDSLKNTIEYQDALKWYNNLSDIQKRAVQKQFRINSK